MTQFSEGRVAPAGARIVYVDGAFDLFHPGHVAFLKVHVFRQLFSAHCLSHTPPHCIWPMAPSSHALFVKPSVAANDALQYLLFHHPTEFLLLKLFH